MEMWKDIYFLENGVEYDYRGLYQVSNVGGRVKSLNYKHTGKEKILKPQKDKKGYLQVGLWKNGKEKKFKIHRLVAFMFIENDDIENKTEVNHKDENKENNSAENLEWCTRKYNCNYGNRNKKMSEAMKGENHPMYGIHRYGKDAPNYGKHHTEETKQKLSEANKGKNHPRAKRVAQYDKQGNLIKIWDYAKQVTEELGINNSNIIQCCKGKCKSAGGYIFKYHEELE